MPFLFFILVCISFVNIVLSFVYNVKGSKGRNKKLENFIRILGVLVLLSYIVGTIYLILTNQEYWKVWGEFVIFSFILLLVSVVATFTLLKKNNSDNFFVKIIQLSASSIAIIIFLLGVGTPLRIENTNYYISTSSLTPFNENIDVILSQVGGKVNISYYSEGEVQNVLTTKENIIISSGETPKILIKKSQIVTMNILGFKKEHGEEIKEINISADNIANRQILSVDK